MVADDNLSYTDGNELAGPLSDIFTVDVTSAVGRCARCGRASPMAMLHLYGHDGPGWVARCPRGGAPSWPRPSRVPGRGVPWT